MRPIFRSIPSALAEPRTPGIPSRRPRALCALEELALELIYGPDELSEIENRVDLIAPPLTHLSKVDHADLLEQAEILITGWGCPLLSEEFLDSTPNLEAIFYGSGALGPVITPAVWDRGIVVSSAYAANAIPVAEYTLSTILFSLKQGWQAIRATRELKQYRRSVHVTGAYGSTVGLVSMGMIARTLLKHLALCDLRVIAFDPYLDLAEARELGVELVTLDELFRQSDVVSLHTPLFPETRGLITGLHIASMKPCATFINTSRGPIVCEEQMLDVLENRADLQAVLDVCVQEPPEADSRLFSLPNVVLTPHLAGSLGNECRRMGRFVVDELDRYIAGEPLQGVVTPKLAEHSSHRPDERARKRAMPAAVV